MNIQLKTLTMKTKLIFAIITCLILSSCIKDFYGHPDDKDGILTQTNYIYTDDLKTEFLKIEVAKGETEIKELTVIANSPNATNKDSMNLASAQQTLDANLNLISKLGDFRNQVFKVRPPLPPCPEPQNCSDWLNIQYITQRSAGFETLLSTSSKTQQSTNLEELQLIIYDKDKNVIAQTDGSPERLDGLEVELDYIVLQFSNKEYRGDINVKIIQTNKGGIEDSFSIESKIK